MAKGMEMMFDALRKLIPPDVWDLVVQNVTKINDNVGSVKKDIEEIKAQNKLLITMVAALYASEGFVLQVPDLHMVNTILKERHNGEASPS